MIDRIKVVYEMIDLLIVLNKGNSEVHFGL